jgi:hypothetical protein
MFMFMHLTVCVTGAGAGVASAWEQEKPEARKMLAVGAAESPASSTRFVSHLSYSLKTFSAITY